MRRWKGSDEEAGHCEGREGGFETEKRLGRDEIEAWREERHGRRENQLAWKVGVSNDHVES